MVKKISWVDTNWYVWTRTAKYNYFFLSNPDLIETLQLFNRMNNFQWQPCTFFSREKTTRNVHAFVENQSKGFSKSKRWAILHNEIFFFEIIITLFKHYQILSGSPTHYTNSQIYFKSGVLINLCCFEAIFCHKLINQYLCILGWAQWNLSSFENEIWWHQTFLIRWE